ncbi:MULTISPECIES: helix-turn-helix transcriptional regulator [Enterobacteriaceae]|uniref:Arabinose operon regulatory protein n=1 Tax=Kluyvera genomosp. 2 TaxID=2774054 RepID=A0A2T2Y6M8_9ENTR|nr:MULTISPECIES: AraC family transcriptional regulator [Enterobacteriaceae]HAT3917401.1 AraC family transcriptional regulator [Kluyvera ascorbata]PSR48098.1 AraC family transcriptional regulator [Kluyvera genomosp. 2]BBQ84690.1 AraC family transcriptional regulator [Klebsiella sp. WP3-W18-ESBL-02]BBR21740.1 AraC family transcriptional regulator [Klebsiella sp. WP3-S18-ESBL-05]BBR58150.1 AraC family transcriptional regulator [Klebsiella sp. WP4-W18-ESBL-05]
MGRETQKTRIVANWYRESDEFSTLVNYRILRAGHIQTAENFHVRRQSVVGHELIFCLNGSGFIRMENTLHPVKKGGLAWLPVRWPHEHFPNKEEPWEILWVRIEGGKLNNLMQILEVSRNPVFQFEQPDKVTEIYNHIFSMMHTHTLVADARCDLLCAQLIFMLLENRSFEAERTPIILHRGLGKLIYQIHSHYSDEWDIEKFMHYCQVSKPQLFRLFQATFNQSPLKWLKNYRLSQARRLLVETNDSISRIAALVGYNDPLHFSRDFHRVSGFSPSEFRRKEQHLDVLVENQHRTGP